MPEIGRAHVRTPVTQIYTLSLHDALPIYRDPGELAPAFQCQRADRDEAAVARIVADAPRPGCRRSEEHTSELPSPRSTLFPYTTLFRSIVPPGSSPPRSSASEPIETKLRSPGSSPTRHAPDA